LRLTRMRLRGSTPSARSPSTTRVPSAPEAPETMIRSSPPWACAAGVNALQSARTNARRTATGHGARLEEDRVGVMSTIPVVWDKGMVAELTHGNARDKKRIHGRAGFPYNSCFAKVRGALDAGMGPASRISQPRQPAGRASRTAWAVLDSCQW